jgi:hypothetical protein
MKIKLKKYEKIKLSVKNKYNGEILSFGSINLAATKIKKINKENLTFESFFNEIENTELNDNKILYSDIDIYNDDNIDIVKKKIEKLGKIPYKYQLLYFIDEKIPLGYIFSGEIIKLNKNTFTKREIYTKFIDKRFNIPVWRDMECIDLRDVINELNDDISIENTFNNVISIYFPLINIIDFKNMIFYGNYEEKVNYYQFSKYRSKFYDINIKQLKYLTSSINVLTKIEQYLFFYPINLHYLFSNFTTDKTNYTSMIYRIDDKNIYKKYDINSKLTFDVIPDTNSILINNDISIFKTGEIIYRNTGTNFNIIDKISKILVDNEILKKIITYNVSINIMIPFVMNYKYLRNTLQKFYDIVKWELIYGDLSTNYVKFTYLGVNNDTDNIIVKIYGENILNININHIKDIDDGNKVILFIMRILYLYMFDWAKTIKFIDNKYIQKRKRDYLLKDPVLFNYSKYIFPGSPYNIYTRICQKNRQPLIFDADSDIFKHFIKVNNISKNKILYLKNHTYPDMNMAYISNNEKYPYISLIDKSKHPLHLSLPCSSKKSIKIKESNDIITNVYYIKKYNPNMKLNINRISYLPNALNSFINSKNPCMIDNNIIKINSKCYFVTGSKHDNSILNIISQRYKLPKNIDNIFKLINYMIKTYNIFLFIFSEKNNEIDIILNYDIASTIYFLNNCETLFILKSILFNNQVKYNLIKRIESKYKKHYINTFQFVKSDIIVSLSLSILKMLKKQDNSIIDKINNYVQLLNDNYYVKGIIVDDLYLSTELHLPNRNNKIIYKFDIKINKKLEVDKFIKKYNLNISSNIVDVNDLIIGYKIGDNTILFNPIKSSRQNDNKIKLYINSSIIEKKWQTQIDVDLEIYNILFYYIIYYVNKTDQKIYNITKKKLLKLYKNIDDEFYYSDLNLLNDKQFKFMNIFKTYKMKFFVIKTYKKMYTFIINLLNKHITFDNITHQLSYNHIRRICPTNIGSLVNQCSNNGKLLINKKKYLIYINLIAHQLINNFIIRQRVIKNIMIDIIHNTNFSFEKTHEKIIKLT